MHMQEFGSRSSPVLESISKSLGIPSTLKHPVPPNQNAWLQLEQQIIHNASSSWMGQGHNRSHEWKSGQGCTWIWSHTSFTSCMLSHSRCVWLFVTLWTVASQAPLSMGFSRQENCRGLPFPPPGDLPDPGIKPASLVSPALAGSSFTEAPGNPFYQSRAQPNGHLNQSGIQSKSSPGGDISSFLPERSAKVTSFKRRRMSP